MAVVVALVGPALGLVSAVPAHAATFTVNTTADPTAGSCSTGSGSLRQCIAAAAANAGPDLITFSVNGVFVLDQGQLVVDSDLTIQGRGPANTVVDGNHASRVLFIDSNGALTMTGVTVRNGLDTGQARGGGIVNLGYLSLTNSVVTANKVSDTGVESYYGWHGSAGGAGIFSNATLVLRDSTVSGNVAEAHVSQPGGRAESLGGGLFVIIGSVSITNTTISGNRTEATGATTRTEGGGMFVGGATGTVTNTTIAANVASSGSGFRDDAELILYKNTIVALNEGGSSCHWSRARPHNNLSDDSSCFPGATNIHADPLLGPLADNGGPTPTHALLPGSPAVDAVGSACPPPATDQRGVARPQGVRCDIGAFELSANAPPDCSGVTATPDVLWPTGHKLATVRLSGLRDPEGGPTTLNIVGVTTNESENGPGDGNTVVDAQPGTTSDEVLVRAERSGTGGGRVYRIAFSGTDSAGATCTGTVTVSVAHDRSPGLQGVRS